VPIALIALVGGLAPLRGCAQEPGGQPQWMALINPDNSFGFNFYDGTKSVGELSAGGWGPNWGWRPFGSKDRGQGQTLHTAAQLAVDKANDQIINCTLDAAPSGANSVTYTYTLQADKDVPTTEFMASVAASKDFQDGNLVATLADGTTKTFPLALNQIASVDPVSRLDFQSKSAGTWSVTIDPAAPLHIQNAVRILFAKDVYPAGTKTYKLTFTMPGEVSFLSTDQNIARFVKTLPGDDWYTFNSHNDIGPSALGFENWLDKPAGKHGGVRLTGDHFTFEDGTPVKFWGTNLAYGSSAPTKEDADFMAARFAKWGVNAIRMHKFTGVGWAGIGDPNDDTKFDPAGLDRLDYFASALAKNGVYYGWSHTYNFEVRPGNSTQVLDYDEIKNNLKGDSYGLINFAPDIQDLLIQSVVNLLQHQNPYTGKTYAQDPALAYIELQNEDDIFFYSSGHALDSCPTYKKHVGDLYAAWLKQKYGTQDALKAAWGDALGGNETLDAGNFSFETNPWMFTGDHFVQVSPSQKVRLLDNAAFFHALQDMFYAKFVKAIRGTGYAGPLVGSPWQAPAVVPHYYNLLSDAEVGYIDRHNYFGGGLNDSMLSQPGGGDLSSGLEQVANRPFGVSEWIHVYPSLYNAEGPAIFAAYGLGLQGWSASYEFQSNGGHSAFMDHVGNEPFGVWNADTPTQIGQYPILARMIARGDVKTGDVISVRRLTPDELASGQLNFSDDTKQSGDVKTFGGSTPPAALAAGRCLVEFAKQPTASTLPDMTQFMKDGVIHSNTGQLAWDPSNGGFFTINTAGTQGVVGFAQGKEQDLGDVKVTLNCPYASLLITAADKDASLKTGNTALISAFARNSNSGFSYFTLDQKIISNGQGPILMEPVKATVTFTGRNVTAVNLLDHDGKETGNTIPVNHGSFTIDGTTDKTPYYEVVFGK